MGGSIAFTTDYVLRGVSQSHGAGALQAQIHYQTPGGWLAGLWASNTNLNPEDGRTAEINAFAGRAWRLSDDWSSRVAVAHYAYPWNTPGGFYDYDELTAGVAYRDFVFLTVAISPNTPLETASGENRDRTAVAYEIALRRPFLGDLSAIGGVGHYGLSGLPDWEYWYWNAGLGYDFHPWHFDLSWFGSSSTAVALFEADMPRNRWAATLMWRF